MNKVKNKNISNELIKKKLNTWASSFERSVAAAPAP